MAHPCASLGADACSDHLVIGEKRSVKEQAIGVRQAALQIGVHRGTARNVKCCVRRLRRGDTKADRVARLGAETLRGQIRVFEKERYFAWNGKCLDDETGGLVAGVSDSRRLIERKLAPLDDRWIEHV